MLLMTQSRWRSSAFGISHAHYPRFLRLHLSFLHKHGAPTGTRNSNLGHPNLAEAPLGKNFSVWLRRCYTSSMSDTCRVWSFDEYLCPGHRLFWCKRRHIARLGGDIWSRDARISTRGCPNLPRLEKPGCSKLRKDARTWVKMPESRLAIRIIDHWINHSILLFLIVKTIIHGAKLMHNDILSWIIFKIFNSSWHVPYTGVISLLFQILCMYVCMYKLCL